MYIKAFEGALNVDETSIMALNSMRIALYGPHMKSGDIKYRPILLREAMLTLLRCDREDTIVCGYARTKESEWTKILDELEFKVMKTLNTTINLNKYKLTYNKQDIPAIPVIDLSFDSKLKWSNDISISMYNSNNHSLLEYVETLGHSLPKNKKVLLHEQTLKADILSTSVLTPCAYSNGWVCYHSLCLL
eukprot:GHVR01059433.1.p1 GENE.GHVR01059433.1~~GHVR01059433.1.p1  ORF type:complete len:190 (+),score=19.95 GHVR01059433.1:117-686(+)